jgi:hypothetical protein
MTPLLQDILALGLVALAILFMVWRLTRRSGSSAAGCEHCSTCQPSPPPAEDLPLIQIEPWKEPSPRDGGK